MGFSSDKSAVLARKSSAIPIGGSGVFARQESSRGFYRIKRPALFAA